MRDERLNISKRLNADNSIARKTVKNSIRAQLMAQLMFCAHFHNTRRLISSVRVWNLPKTRVAEIVDFLLRLGVMSVEKNLLAPGPRHVHLGNDSEMILKHHSNWRMHAISNLQILDKDDLHYSSCLSISHEGAFRVKEAILETLKKTVTMVQDSDVETGYVLNLSLAFFMAQ